MNKREQQKERTGKKLFEAALQTYRHKGFVNTSIDDLTKSAGISHGNFFVHYAKREDLIIKVIEEIGKAIYERFLELAGEGMSLENILGVHLDIIQENEAIYYYLVTEGPFLPEQARNAIYILQNGISHWMNKVVDTEKTGLQFHYFFNLWLGNLHYYLQNRDIFSPDESVIEKYRDDFIKMFKLLEGGKGMSSKCISCGSCGMPLVKESDFSGGDITHKLCAWCGDHEDHLKVTMQEVVVDCAKGFMEKQGLDDEAALKMARQYIASLPVWKGNENELQK